MLGQAQGITRWDAGRESHWLSSSGYVRHFLQTCSRLVNVSPDGLQLDGRSIKVATRCGEWTELADTCQINVWKSCVRPTLEYFLKRTLGAVIVERPCSLVFRYYNTEDYESACRHASELASHINDSSGWHRLHAVHVQGAVIIEPRDWTKTTAAQVVLELLQVSEASCESSSSIDFLMVAGEGFGDEHIFK